MEALASKKCQVLEHLLMPALDTRPEAYPVLCFVGQPGTATCHDFRAKTFEDASGIILTLIAAQDPTTPIGITVKIGNLFFTTEGKAGEIGGRWLQGYIKDLTNWEILDQ